MDIEKMRGAVISQVRVNREFEERIAKIEEFLDKLASFGLMAHEALELPHQPSPERQPAEDALRPRPMLEGGLPGECNL